MKRFVLLGIALVAGRAGAQLKVVDPTYMDTTAKACTDFFHYAVGTWLAHDTIAPDYPYSGVSRDMQDHNEAAVHSVLDDAVAHRQSTPDTSTEHKLGTFYATCMDSSSAEQAGMTPIQPALDSI